MSATQVVQTAILRVVGNATCLYAGCTCCNRIVSQGKWAIALETDQGPFLVGQYPRMQCCDADVKAPFFFEDEN